MKRPDWVRNVRCLGTKRLGTKRLGYETSWYETSGYRYDTWHWNHQLDLVEDARNGQKDR